MLLSFEELPADSRIWIYQADKVLDAALEEALTAKINQFVESWEAHGKPLRASVSVLYNRFLIIGVDESFNPVTGCSTDASVNFVRSLGREFNIDFFNRMQMPLVVNDAVELVALDRFRKKELPNEVTPDTITFDNLIQQKGQLEDAWMKPVGQTWLSKYL